MGGSISKLAGSAKQETRILMVGLDSAGKTTILYKMKLGELVQTIPTIGFNMEYVTQTNQFGHKIDFSIWDVGSRGKIRALWRHFFQNTQAVVFVVNSADRNPERIEEVRQELDKMLKDEELKDAVLMVLANKQDLPNAMSIAELSEKLNLKMYEFRRQAVFGVSAVSADDHLAEAFDWLASELDNRAPAPPPAPPTTDLATLQPKKSALIILERIEVVGDKDSAKFLALFEHPTPEFQEAWNHCCCLRLIHMVLHALGRQKGVKWLHANFASWAKITGLGRDIYHVTLVYFWIQIVDYCRAVDVHEANAAKQAKQANNNLSNDNDLLLQSSSTSTTSSTTTTTPTTTSSTAATTTMMTTSTITKSSYSSSSCLSPAPAPSAPAVPLDKLPTWEDFAAFVQRHDMLRNRDLHQQYYTPKTLLHNPSAFVEFVLPDKMALPSLVQLKQ